MNLLSDFTIGELLRQHKYYHKQNHYIRLTYALIEKMAVLTQALLHEKVTEEMADVLLYFESLRRELGLPLDEVIATVEEKANIVIKRCKDGLS